ncbi:hypothetical protein EUBVEN_00291 [Eubacterium ventriosum ATCC 27560]|uniref:Uncharacterized protein n=1 Tax=Eubacterium ventriosum ATCC 27560 TaxID=411463 RepID=A5Z3P5_9FIRM|nr:hypothetical protein EUBVEN_00291 [Eubacterium ventriosum ATCC 27560]
MFPSPAYVALTDAIRGPSSPYSSLPVLTISDSLYAIFKDTLPFTMFTIC